ncbi:AgmX/PglI C-terminal domain-containing protein [Bdellovibrionota bacterium FG-2]
MNTNRVKDRRYLVILTTAKGDTKRPWDMRKPLHFRKPLHWTLRATETGVLLNSTEYREDLLRIGVRLTPGVWIRILPSEVPEPAFSNTAVLERSWRGTLERASHHSNFQRFSASLLLSSFLLLGPIALWRIPPKLDIEEVLIPPQFARVIMSQKIPISSGRSPSYATSGGGASAKLRALVSSEISLPQTQRAIFSRQPATVGTSFNAQKALSAALPVAEMTGQALETLVGKGAGYRVGEVHRLEGQGNSKIEIGHALAIVDEGLSRDEVGKVIYSHLGEIRACYESAIIRNPGAEGKLVMNFFVTPSGGARSVSVSPSSSNMFVNNSRNDSGLEQCIARNLSAWRFPSPKGGTEVAVSYPFIFKMLGRI